MDELEFMRAFAENGQKALITDKEYRGGWYDVVGGINGIPTVQQFNAIMNYQERKINALYRMIQGLVDVFTRAPVVTEAKMRDYLDSPEEKAKIDGFRIGQVAIADKHVYTYIGDDPYNMSCWCECGGHGASEGFNVAVPFYLVFNLMTGNAGDYGMVRMPEYDNAFNLAAAFFATFGSADGSVYDYSSGTIAYTLNEADIEPAFLYVFGRKTVEMFDPMTPEEIQKAIGTGWNGEASTNPYALTPEEIQKAINTEWDGGPSKNPFAIAASQISDITKK